jgi:hypothetical protein
MAKQEYTFTPNFNVKIKGNTESVFIGATDKDGNIKEEKCNLDEEYKNCKKYLESLTQMDKLLIFLYTKGILNKVINKLNFEQIYDILITNISPIHRESIYYLFSELIKYRIMLNITDEDTFLNDLLKFLIENINIKIDEICAYLSDPSDTNEFYYNKIDALRNLDYLFERDDIIFLRQIQKIFMESSDKNKIIMKLLHNMNNYIKLSDLISYLFDLFVHIDNKWFAYIKYLDHKFDEIIMNSPPLNKQIRVYRADDYMEKYKLNEIIINKSVLSTSCSQKTNITYFIQNIYGQNSCCIGEYILNPGTHVLFLDYEKTPFGEQMYEVIVQKDIKCKLIKIEDKNVVVIKDKKEENSNDINDINEFVDEIKNEISLKEYEIKKIYNIEYDQTSVKVKPVKSYLFEQIS